MNSKPISIAREIQKRKEILTLAAATKASLHETRANVVTVHNFKSGVTVIESRVARCVGSLTYRATLGTVSPSSSLSEVLRHRCVKSVEMSQMYCKPGRAESPETQLVTGLLV